VKPLIKYIIPTVSLLTFLSPEKTTQACGFYTYPGEFRFWLLQPDLTNQQDLTPFFFASSYLYKGDMYAGKENYPEQNINEWYKEVHGKATKPDINKLLNETPPQNFFDEPHSLKVNSLMRYLLQPENKELYRYFVLSKKVEQIATNNDPWGENNFPKPAIQNTINEANELYNQTHSPFVKLRTAFQMVRLYGYNSQVDLLNKTYDTWIEPVHSPSWIKTAALYQKAIYSRDFQYDYLLSKVFDKGDYNRTFCLVRFNSKNLDSILSLAKNKHERNVLYAMKAFNYQGRSLNYIRDIYNAEPSNKELSFLLLREINKIEDWLVTNKVTDFEFPAVYNSSQWNRYEYRDNATVNYHNDQRYAKEVYDFLLQMIQNKKNPEQPLLNLYAAHLAMLNGNYPIAQQHLNNAGSFTHLPLNVQTQIRINQYLLHLEKGFDSIAEREFMSIINAPANKLGIYDPDIMKDQLILYSARKMIEKGDKPKGLMLLSKTRRAMGDLPIGQYKGLYQEIEEIADAKDYDNILRILGKTSKTEFEKFVSKEKLASPQDYYAYSHYDGYAVYWNRNKVLDCKASWYIRNHDLNSAIKTLKQIPDSFYSKEPYTTYIGGDPFFLNIYHSYKPTKEDKKNLNKKQVVEQMIHLEKLAQNNKTKAAECYYQLANAWYNMTYYGKNWLMVKQWWSDNEISFYDPGFKFSSFNNDYYGCSYAKQYYLKAANETRDKKLKALCSFMAATCEKNFDLYNWCLRDKKRYKWKYREGVNFYRLLKQNGIEEKYYKEIVEECELYQSYINDYNKNL